MRTPKVGRGNFPQPPTGDVKPGDEWYDWCVDVWEDANPDVELPKIFKVQEGEIKLVGALPEYHPLRTGCLFVKVVACVVIVFSVVVGLLSQFTTFFDVAPNTILIVMAIIGLGVPFVFAIFRKI